MQYGELPDGLTWQRVTPDFSLDTVPAGLLRAHHLASDVWGVITCVAGDTIFIFEDTDSGVVLHPGDSLVIEPEVLHHVDLTDESVFHVEFYKRQQQ